MCVVWFRLGSSSARRCSAFEVVTIGRTPSATALRIASSIAARCCGRPQKRATTCAFRIKTINSSVFRCSAAGRILGLDDAQMRNALAFAFNRCGGSFQSNVDGSTDTNTCSPEAAASPAR